MEINLPYATFMMVLLGLVYIFAFSGDDTIFKYTFT